MLTTLRTSQGIADAKSVSPWPVIIGGLSEPPDALQLSEPERAQTREKSVFLSALR